MKNTIPSSSEENATSENSLFLSKSSARLPMPWVGDNLSQNNTSIDFVHNKNFYDSLILKNSHAIEIAEKSYNEKDALSLVEPSHIHFERYHNRTDLPSNSLNCPSRHSGCNLTSRNEINPPQEVSTNSDPHLDTVQDAESLYLLTDEQEGLCNATLSEDPQRFSPIASFSESLSINTGSSFVPTSEYQLVSSIDPSLSGSSLPSLFYNAESASEAALVLASLGDAKNDKVCSENFGDALRLKHADINSLEPTTCGVLEANSYNICVNSLGDSNCASTFDETTVSTQSALDDLAGANEPDICEKNRSCRPTLVLRSRRGRGTGLQPQYHDFPDPEKLVKRKRKRDAKDKELSIDKSSKSMVIKQQKNMPSMKKDSYSASEPDTFNSLHYSPKADSCITSSKDPGRESPVLLSELDNSRSIRLKDFHKMYVTQESKGSTTASGNILEQTKDNVDSLQYSNYSMQSENVHNAVSIDELEEPTWHSKLVEQTCSSNYIPSQFTVINSDDNAKCQIQFINNEHSPKKDEYFLDVNTQSFSTTGSAETDSSVSVLQSSAQHNGDSITIHLEANNKSSHNIPVAQQVIVDSESADSHQSSHYISELDTQFVSVPPREICFSASATVIQNMMQPHQKELGNIEFIVDSITPDDTSQSSGATGNKVRPVLQGGIANSSHSANYQTPSSTKGITTSSDTNILCTNSRIYYTVPQATAEILVRSSYTNHEGIVPSYTNFILEESEECVKENSFRDTNAQSVIAKSRFDNCFGSSVLSSIKNSNEKILINNSTKRRNNAPILIPNTSVASLEFSSLPCSKTLNEVPEKSSGYDISDDIAKNTLKDASNKLKPDVTYSSSDATSSLKSTSAPSCNSAQITSPVTTSQCGVSTENVSESQPLPSCVLVLTTEKENLLGQLLRASEHCEPASLIPAGVVNDVIPAVGYRIVEVSNLSAMISSMHSCSSTQQGTIVIQEQASLREGAVSQLSVICTACQEGTVCATSNRREISDSGLADSVVTPWDINVRVQQLVNEFGLSEQQMQRMLEILGIFYRPYNNSSLTREVVNNKVTGKEISVARYPVDPPVCQEQNFSTIDEGADLLHSASASQKAVPISVSNKRANSEYIPMVRKRSRPPKKDEPRNKPRVLACKDCPAKFVSQNHLKKHAQTHDLSQHTCPYCHAYFRKPYNLKEHIKKHENVKYACNLCGQQYTDRSTLMVHRKAYHELKYEFKCDVCSKMFYRRVHYLEHMRLHTREAPFACEVCGKRFIWRDSVKRHMSTHNANAKYNCRLCGKWFRWLQGVRQHLQQQHKLKKSDIQAQVNAQFNLFYEKNPNDGPTVNAEVTSLAEVTCENSENINDGTLAINNNLGKDLPAITSTVTSDGFTWGAQSMLQSRISDDTGQTESPTSTEDSRGSNLTKLKQTIVTNQLQCA